MVIGHHNNTVHQYRHRHRQSSGHYRLPSPPSTIPVSDTIYRHPMSSTGRQVIWPSSCQVIRVIVITSGQPVIRSSSGQVWPSSSSDVIVIAGHTVIVIIYRSLATDYQYHYHYQHVNINSWPTGRHVNITDIINHRSTTTTSVINHHHRHHQVINTIIIRSSSGQSSGHHHHVNIRSLAGRHHHHVIGHRHRHVTGRSSSRLILISLSLPISLLPCQPLSLLSLHNITIVIGAMSILPSLTPVITGQPTSTGYRQLAVTDVIRCHRHHYHHHLSSRQQQVTVTVIISNNRRQSSLAHLVIVIWPSYWPSSSSLPSSRHHCHRHHVIGHWSSSSGQVTVIGHRWPVITSTGHWPVTGRRHQYRQNTITDRLAGHPVITVTGQLASPSRQQLAGHHHHHHQQPTITSPSPSSTVTSGTVNITYRQPGRRQHHRSSPHRYRHHHRHLPSLSIINTVTNTVRSGRHPTSTSSRQSSSGQLATGHWPTVTTVNHNHHHHHRRSIIITSSPSEYRLADVRPSRHPVNRYLAVIVNYRHHRYLVIWRHPTSTSRQSPSIPSDRPTSTDVTVTSTSSVIRSTDHWPTIPSATVNRRQPTSTVNRFTVTDATTSQHQHQHHITITDHHHVTVTGSTDHRRQPTSTTDINNVNINNIITIPSPSPSPSADVNNRPSPSPSTYRQQQQQPTMSTTVNHHQYRHQLAGHHWPVITVMSTGQLADVIVIIIAIRRHPVIIIVIITSIITLVITSLVTILVTVIVIVITVITIGH